ncbi:hypothetical protein pb186bvf_013799 [Paramecium bursaria]
MFYQVSPNRQGSPLMIRKTSHYQAIPHTYFTSIKTTPVKGEQKFDPVEKATPDKVRFNEIDKIRFDISNLQKALDISNEDRNRLRYGLEQKNILCVNKEREIAQLLSTIHQLELKKQDQSIIKDQQAQIEQLKQFIQQNYDTKKYKDLIGENEALLSEIDSLQKYVRDLLLFNKELQQKYQDKCLELQKMEINMESIEILQKQLKGKDEQIDILKSGLRSYSSRDSQMDQQNEIQNFLQQIKKQYIQDSQMDSEYAEEPEQPILIAFNQKILNIECKENGNFYIYIQKKNQRKKSLLSLSADRARVVHFQPG